MLRPLFFGKRITNKQTKTKHSKSLCCETYPVQSPPFAFFGTPLETYGCPSNQMVCRCSIDDKQEDRQKTTCFLHSVRWFYNKTRRYCSALLLLHVFIRFFFFQNISNANVIRMVSGKVLCNYPSCRTSRHLCPRSSLKELEKRFLFGPFLSSLRSAKTFAEDRTWQICCCRCRTFKRTCRSPLRQRLADAAGCGTNKWWGLLRRIDTQGIQEKRGVS